MSKFEIVLRGKEGEEEEIKVVSAIPGGDGKPGFRLHFPCLSVHVTSDSDNYSQEYYCITWSNYHEKGRPQDAQTGENPGCFKIKRVVMKPEMICLKNGNRNMAYKRAAFPGGKPQYDYCEMAKRWGTTYDQGKGWNYGPDHPMERTEMELASGETVDSIEQELTKRFGDFGVQILEHFVEHDLFLSFFVRMKQAA